MINSDIQFRNLMAAFYILDVTNDESLTLNDFESMAARYEQAMGLDPAAETGQTLLQAVRSTWNRLKEEAGGADTVSLSTFISLLRWRLGSTEDIFQTWAGQVIHLLLAMADGDRDGRVTATEYETMLSALGVEKGLADEAFARLDFDRDGLISNDQLLKNMTEFFVSNDPAARGHWLFGRRDASVFDHDLRYALACTRTKFVDGGALDEHVYQLFRLKPHPTIPEGREVTMIPNYRALPYVSKVLELYAEMKKGYLDPGDPSTGRAPLPFPPLPSSILAPKKVMLKSSKGDYLHRGESALGTWHTGIGNEWLLEPMESGRIKLKSWQGDYLHRPDTASGVGTWSTGIGNEWIVEPLENGKVMLRSWKNDYLNRPDEPSGVSTSSAGVGNEWLIEPIAGAELSADEVLSKDGEADNNITSFSDEQPPPYPCQGILGAGTGTGVSKT